MPEENSKKNSEFN